MFPVVFAAQLHGCTIIYIKPRLVAGAMEDNELKGNDELENDGESDNQPSRVGAAGHVKGM